MKLRALLILALCQLVTVSPVSAGVTNGGVSGGSAYAGGGTFVLLIPPLTNSFGPANTVGSNNFESLNLFGFNELQDVVLSSNLLVDIGTNPVPAGTAISSHYVFFDPPTNSDIAGGVAFDTNVLAIITSTTNLASSDFLALPGVNYAGVAARGLEAGDSANISPPNHVIVQLYAGSPGDYIRVITRSTKMPGGPVVNIDPDGTGTNVVVSWATNSTGYTLQFSTSLTVPIHWTNYPGKPVVVHQQFKVTNTLSGNCQFFRLIKE
jgi:hypothetical protein